MMRYYSLLLCLLAAPSLWGQTQDSNEVFQIVEQMPRFPGCEELTLEGPDLTTCSQQKMLEFIYKHVSYPEQAQEEGIEGTTVVKFVVQKDGSVAEAEVVKEIGGGCGAEALRVVNLMNEEGVRWIPGRQKGEPVRVFFNLPVKFKLETDTPPPPPPPYFLYGVDTIYTQYDEVAIFGDDPAALKAYLSDMTYPKGVDSCVAGAMVAQLFIGKGGQVKLGEMFDYSNLGFDYRFEAIKKINATNGKWQAARRNGVPVNSYLPVRLIFQPDNPQCKSTRDNFDQAYEAAAAAEDAYANGEVQAAIDQWTAALELMPGNSEFLLLRGQAYLETNAHEQACIDLNAAQQFVPLSEWVKQMMTLMCN